MSLGDIVAILGAGMGGYVRGKEMRREQDQQDEDRAWQNEQRDRQRQQWALQDKARNDDAVAAAPAAPVSEVDQKPSTMDNIDVGQPGEGAPVSYMGAGKVYDTTDQAQAATDMYNSPQATMARQAAAFRANQDWTHAQAIMDQAKRAREEGAQDFLRSVTSAAPTLDTKDKSATATFDLPPEAIDSFNSVGSVRVPKGAQAQAFIGKDGRQDIRFIGADGKPIGVPSANTFESMWAFSPKDRAELARQTSNDAWDKDYKSKGQDELIRHNKVDEKNGADKVAASIENAGLRAQVGMLGIAARQGSGGQPAQMTMADLKDGHKAIAATVAGDYKSQIEAADPTTLDTVRNKRDSEILAAQRVFTGSNMNGMPLTADEALAAVRQGTPGTMQVMDKGSGKMVAVQGYRVGNKFIPMSSAAGITVGSPAPAPADAPAPAPDTAPAEPRRVGRQPINWNPTSGIQQRIAAARTQIPALKAAFDDAAARLNKAHADAAAGKVGPMSVEAVRTEWSAARQALQAAQERAGN